MKRFWISMLALAVSASAVVAQDAAAPAGGETLSPMPLANKAVDESHAKVAQQLIKGGIGYLLSKQADDGTWSMGEKMAMKPAMTAMVLKVLLQHPDFNLDTPAVKKGLDALVKYQQPDGGIYDPAEGQETYVTSVAVMTLSIVKDPAYKEKLDAAVKFLKGLQIVPGSQSADGKTIDENSPTFGGVGYGKNPGRPDLSCVGMWMNALHDAGVDSKDEAMQRALVFVTRMQNRSESNPVAWAKEGDNDGGFIYTAGGGPGRGGPGGRGGHGGATSGPGASSAPSAPPVQIPSANPAVKGIRSYGSMTYVGFKSMLYAGVDKTDPRVSAAYAWIRTYWTFDANPNLPGERSQNGLYYYYNVFAKAMHAWGQDEIPDIKNNEVKHNWRQELIDAIAKRVQKDGSWVNTSGMWQENSPTLVTCYVVQSLQETLK